VLRFIIFLAITTGVIYYLYNKLKKSIMSILMPEQKSKKEEKNRIIKGEMIKCPVCGTYFPENTGIKKNGKVYCSIECMTEDTR